MFTIKFLLVLVSAVLGLLLVRTPVHAHSSATGKLLIALTTNCPFAGGGGTEHPHFLLYSDGTALYHRTDLQVYYKAKLSDQETQHLLQVAHQLDSIVRIDNAPDVMGGCRFHLWYDNRSVTLYGDFGSQKNRERTPAPFLELWDQLSSYHQSDEIPWHSDPFFITMHRIDASLKPQSIQQWPNNLPRIHPTHRFTDRLYDDRIALSGMYFDTLARLIKTPEDQNSPPTNVTAPATSPFRIDGKLWSIDDIEFKFPLQKEIERADALQPEIKNPVTGTVTYR